MVYIIPSYVAILIDIIISIPMKQPVFLRLFQHTELEHTPKQPLPTGYI